MLDVPIRAALELGLASIVFEIIAALSKNRTIRIGGYSGVLFLSGFAASILLVYDPGVLTGIIWFISLYRMINAARNLHGTMNSRRLFLVSRRTSLYLIGYLLAAVLVWALDRELNISTTRWLYTLSASALLIVTILNLAVNRNLRKTSIRPSDKYRPVDELPTVSVCVPARNETADLPGLLESILASNYPKLEVLVLDDCSHDQTSEIIRGFAQDGVRFFKGEPPKKGWLAKNQAYQTLAENANGDLLLFCGVDIRFSKQAIWSMVDILESRKKSMLAMLPKNEQITESAGLVQPMRYWWELALPRRLFNRPPVLSSCWLIDRKSLRSLGEFKAVNNTVIPEGYFARELSKTDAYSFLRSNGKLEIASIKQFSEQWATAVRTRYPELRKRPEAVLLLTLVELWLMVTPISLFVAGFFIPLGILWVQAGLTTLLLAFIHYRIVRASQASVVSSALALLPAAVVVEIYLLQYSMMRYEFGSVTWKERNICIPVMRSIPRLPQA